MFNAFINIRLDMATQVITQKNIDPAELLTRDQLAKLLKCSVNTITRLTKQGMPAYFVGVRQQPGKGARPRYNLETCKQWMDARARAFRSPVVRDFSACS